MVLRYQFPKNCITCVFSLSTTAEGFGTLFCSSLQEELDEEEVDVSSLSDLESDGDEILSAAGEI